MSAVPFLFLLALSLWFSFANYGFRGDLIGGDASAMMAYPQQAFHRLLGVYLYSPGLGSNGSVGVQILFPLLLFMVALVKLGFSTAIATRLFIALLFFVSMAGAFTLARLLTDNRCSIGWSRTASIGAALLYGANAFTVFAYSSAENTFTMSYAALPWILFGTIFAIERNWARGIAIVAAAIVFAGDATNQAQFAVACLFVVVGWALKIAEGANIVRASLIAGAGGLLGILCCLWWILPIPTVVNASLGAVAAHDTSTWLSWMSERSSFGEVFKLQGYTGEMTLPYGPWYIGPVGSVVAFAPLVAVIATFGRVRARASAVFLIVFLLLAALAKGSHPPAGQVYVFLTDHLPAFSIFRSPYDKWIEGQALALSCLTALALGAIGNAQVVKEARIGRGMLVCAGLLFCAIVGGAWTLYTGRALNPGAMNVGFISSIPRAYNEVGRYIDSHGRGGRVVIFNSGSWPYALYDWHYFGEDPLLYATQAPITPVEDIQAYSDTLPTARLSSMLAYFGAEFVVVHADVTNPVATPDIDNLVRAGDAREVLNAKQLQLYRLRLVPEPMIRVVRTPVMVEPNAQPDAVTLGFPMTGIDAQFMVSAPPRPVTLLYSNSAVRIGRLREMNARTVGGRLQWSSEPASRGVFIPYNNGAAVWRKAGCGAQAGAIVSAPSLWQLGASNVPTFSKKVCVNASLGSIALFDGTPLASSVSQFSVVGDHRLILSKSPPPVEIELSGQGASTLLSRVTKASGPHIQVRVRGGAVQMLPTGITHSAGLKAQLRSRSGRVTASSALTARTLSLLLPLTSPGSADPDAVLSIASRSSVVRINVETFKQIVTRMSPQVAPIQLKPSNGVQLNRSGVFAQPLTASNSAFSLAPLTLQWYHERRASDPTSRTLLGAAFTVHASNAPMSVVAPGSLLSSDDYVVTLRYRGTGRASLLMWLDGSFADVQADLVMDGKWHLLRVNVFPPPKSNGAFEMSLEDQNGMLTVARARMRDAGPNGSALAVSSPCTFSGSVLRQMKVSAWQYSALVGRCTPCFIALAVADGKHWRVTGARVLATFEGPGGAGGAHILSGGESVWELELPDSGAHMVRFTYAPALLLRSAQIPSLAGFIVLVLLLLPLRVYRSFSPCTPAIELRIAPSRALMVLELVLSLFALAVAVVTGCNWSTLSDVMATALWVLLLGLAFFVFARAARVPGQHAR